MNTSIQKAVANALSFAHLASLGRGKGARASAEDDDKQDDDKDGDAKGKKAKAADDDKGDDDDDKKKDARADDDDPDASAEDDDNDAGDDDKDERKSKKAKAEDENDDDEEMRGSSSAAQARRREQARCAAIFASPAAAKNPVLAANLAFKSRMGRVEAVALLESSPASATHSSNYGDRSARNPRIGAGGSGSLSSSQAAAKSWDAVFQKANVR
jgi:hypothetical protein